MEPRILDGDLVYVTPVRAWGFQEPGLYEIVLFHDTSRDQLVVHRIVGENQSHIFESGDNTRVFSKIDRNQILGIVTHRRRGEKTVPISIPLLWRLRKLIDKLLGRNEQP